MGDLGWIRGLGRSPEQRSPEDPLKKVKEESEKLGLKLNIQKAKIMVFGPITS